MRLLIFNIKRFYWRVLSLLSNQKHFKFKIDKLRKIIDSKIKIESNYKILIKVVEIYNFLNEYQRWFFSFLNYLKKSSKKNYSILHYETNKTIAHLNINELHSTYNILLEFGLYSIALEVRNELLKKSLLQTGNKKYYLIALYETGQFEKIRKTFKKFLHIKNESHREILKIFFNILFSLKVKKYKINYKKISFNIYNYHYKNFLEKKKVAFVGHAKVNFKRGSEIDEFDIVARTNYRGANLKQRKKYDGEKIDISYYNGDTFDKILKQDRRQVPDILKAAVFKANDHIIYTKKNQIKKSCSICLDNLTFDNSSWSMPNIILDLLVHGVKHIKIFSADAKITRAKVPHYAQKYGKYVKPVSTVPKIHDPLSQFIFLKKMYKKKIISGDILFNKMIKMNEKQYMTRLQNNWIKDAKDRK